MIPWLVLTITRPSPPSTRGISVLRAYTRNPGLLMRLSPETTGALPSTYLSVTRSTWCTPSRSSRTSAMKPSSTRIRAICRLVLEAGTTTSACRARDALRMRVSMSAIGSETIIVYLPARLGDAGQLAEERPLTEADAAQTEAPHVRARATTNEATMVGLNLVLRRPLRLGDHRLLSHCFSSPRLDGKGHAEEFEQTLRFLVGLRRRHDADFQPAETVNLVVLDLREGELLAESQRVVAAPVERLRRDPMEVAYAGQGEPREPLEKVPHAIAAQGNAYTDRVSFAQSELRDRALRLGGHRLLTGDRGDVADGGIHGLRIGEGLAETDVDDDLGKPRGLHLVGVAELLLQCRHRLFFVALLKGSAHAPASSCSRQWPQTRTLWPLPRRSCLTRVTRSQRGQTIITLLTSIGIGLSTMPPCCAMLWVVWLMRGRAFWWRLAMFTPEIRIASGRLEVPRQAPAALSLDSRFRRTLSTLPRLPASLPCKTTTVSPVRISGTLLAEAPLA